MTTKFARAGLFFVVAVICAGPAATQSANRRGTDIGSLVTFPGFYHGQPIVLRAELIQTGNSTVLVQSDEARALRVTSNLPMKVAGRVEARGVFWDVGRLNRDDPRVQSNHLQTVVDPGTENDWPKPGELFALHVTDVFAAETPARPTLRDVVLDPSTYVDKEVTITGQFRGRNLYGDLPQAPGLSRWDFVVKSADAALWVTGTQPRGKGFNLNVSARIDTGRWLEVSGVLKRGRGLVWLESVTIAAAEPPVETISSEAAAPEPGPAPVVVFSAPGGGERDVPLTTPIRVQFSRDMDQASFKGQIRATYAPTATSGQTPVESPALDVVPSYDPATRSLTLRFTNPPMRLRTVRVEFLAGIKAFDGAAMAPWTLSFESGN